MSHNFNRDVVVRYANGKVLQGRTFNLDARSPSFHLFPADTTVDRGIEVFLKDLKAVFFVRSFAGNPAYSERKEVAGPPPPGTRKIAVEFADGEVLVGYTSTCGPRHLGIFFSPVDPDSNNVRVFAVLSAVKTLTLDSVPDVATPHSKRPPPQPHSPPTMAR